MATNTTHPAHRSRTTQAGIIRTGIRSRTLLTRTPTPGLIRLIVMTNTGTAGRIDATDYV